jgi:hypothetical protein
MKTTRSSPAPRAPREKRARDKWNYEEALRACETAAGRIKAAGDELAASWTALCQEITGGGSCTDLLRKRAWCNVLELRLKEQAHALEDARQNVDVLWNDLMLTARARDLFRRMLRRSATGAAEAAGHLPLLARTTSTLTGAPRRPAAVKR